jgi:hypothetical protein
MVVETVVIPRFAGPPTAERWGDGGLLAAHFDGPPK